MRIVIKDLKFYTIIGGLEKERISEQEVIINCKIDYKYEKYIDYAFVVEFIKNDFITKKYEIIEDALIYITNELKRKFDNIEKIYLQVLKPEILTDCVVGVEIEKNYIKGKMWDFLL